MPIWRPDSTFYPSPRLAMEAPGEGLAYVALLRTGGRPDGFAVVDVDPRSATYGRVVHTLDFPYTGDEVHHFGWNACSSALCPFAPHPHVERRYLLVPGLRSSRIYILDTKPDPAAPRLVKVVEPEEVLRRAGYSRLHTVHCGPDGIYVSALGGREGDGPGGILILDHDSFDVLGRWEVDRGPQVYAYDFWWHLGHDTVVTSEWGAPSLFEGGLNLDDVVNRRYGHRLHFWDLRRRRHVQEVDLGDQHQMVLELRPAHDPSKAYGFVGVVVSVEDLSGSVWLWYRDGDRWAVRKVIEIPAEPAEDKDALPDILKPLGAVPPLITDINLSLDDRFLYVSCWGTGELRQYDVSDPFHPRLAGSVRLGGVVRRAAHPAAGPLTGGPQMVEVSRDGRRVYVTNSLYSTWDDQFYPGLRGWLVKLDADPAGGLAVDPGFFVDFGESRPHQVRLQGGDSSSDSFCFPS
ncbi:selenium-binding protein SBP56-related protein [Thermaerobacter subterraneus]|uniref:Methanethiol oxidase n=1 Tax=Thermaerobacter subterraneus DSM 13965 TaxID=867903 RepID=K6Q2U7_9FIRM|nr:selenium-binding protein SBP56-related protein [Thermaerobacter subterraneus]EKP95379.1 56kDa selenium binding protein (SBP56) [Thermaerobacter subterraneus DSM 13965]